MRHPERTSRRTRNRTNSSASRVIRPKKFAIVAAIAKIKPRKTVLFTKRYSGLSPACFFTVHPLLR
jgi:hypothetical protein